MNIFCTWIFFIRSNWISKRCAANSESEGEAPPRFSPRREQRGVGESAARCDSWLSLGHSLDDLEGDKRITNRSACRINRQKSTNIYKFKFNVQNLRPVNMSKWPFVEGILYIYIYIYIHIVIVLSYTRNWRRNIWFRKYKMSRLDRYLIALIIMSDRTLTTFAYHSLFSDRKRTYV